MNVPRITIDQTPGGYFFVKIDPPQEKYPMRSFGKLKDAKEYKWFVELRLCNEPDPEAAS